MIYAFIPLHTLWHNFSISLKSFPAYVRSPKGKEEKKVRYQGYLAEHHEIINNAQKV